MKYKKKIMTIVIIVLFSALIINVKNVFAGTQVFVEDKPLVNYKIIDGKTYVELRELSEITNTSLAYDANTKQVKYNSSTNVLPIKEVQIKEENKREIVRTYKVPIESVASINKEKFVVDGYIYELSDIKNEREELETKKEATQNIEMNVAKNDMNYIISKLQPTKNYTDNDGYAGELKLDISSIHSEVAGYKKNSFTKSETRTYPNLSDMDISVIPKSITVGGVTCSLVNVSWKESQTDSADYEEVSTSYTAVASYSGTGSNSSITGYNVTANYLGEVTKKYDGDAIVTMIFTGTKNIEQDQEIDSVGNIENNKDKSIDLASKQVKKMDTSKKWIAFFMIIVTFLTGLIGLAYMFLSRNEHKDDDFEEYDLEEYDQTDELTEDDAPDIEDQEQNHLKK